MSERKRVSWVRGAIVVGILGLVVAGLIAMVLRHEEPPVPSVPIQARLELAAGVVTVGEGEVAQPAVSGTALRAGASVSTAAGARALVRLPDGSTTFLRGSSQVQLGDGAVTLKSGEYWLDVPPLERAALVHRAGEVTVSAADAGLSVRIDKDVAQVYVARGMALVSSPGGRVEVNAGEQARIEGNGAPKVDAVAFWDDWTGGMADFEANAAAPGAGAGTIYGVDVGAPAGSPARRLQIKKQSVRAVLRDGLSETEVDQTFFNPGPRPVEGWYWFVIPPGASVTGFAVETNGNLVEGEFIEKREAAAKYGKAKSSGHAPAILEWIDGRSYRARIFPVPATGSRRVVLRYLELSPTVDGKLSYVYPMGRGASARIGEFSLSVELGKPGRAMQIATLDDARIEDGGTRVTMRRSGYTPRVDFQLEARVQQQRAALRVSRFATGSEGADYIMARYTPQIDWSTIKPPRADVVVVVDTSADGDEAARQLKATAAEAILRALSEEDQFALVSLDVKPTVVHPKKALAPAKDKEIATALERLSEHASGGATDLASLFDAALGRVHGAEQPAVIYVGDGLATSGEMSGEQLIERLRRALGTSRARLFTVGVGEGADRPLLGELARAGGGESFAVDMAGQATEQALQLVAAVKVPTITDFSLDLGAGLDEPFSNLTGKVPRGSDVLMLARTHHELPREATVRGRVGGESFEKTVKLVRDEGVLTAFVPRLWASAYVQRLLGAAAGPETERGRIVALGVEYGLVTPFTSVLALESEWAYRQMGIPRNKSRLRGVRLGALTPRQERRLVNELHPLPPQMAFGCNAISAGAADEEAAQSETEKPAALPNKYRAKGEEGSEDSKVATSPATPGPFASAAPAEPEPVERNDNLRLNRRLESKAKEGGKLGTGVAGGSRPPSDPTDADKDALEELAANTPTPKPAPPAAAAVASAMQDARSRPPSMQPKRPAGTPAQTGRTRGPRRTKTNTATGATGKKRWRPSKPVLAACSDLARRPLAQRMVLWRKRLKTAGSPRALLARYESARRACELNDWREEQAFLSLMQRHVNSEGGIAILLAHFVHRPQVQHFVARLIVRRTMDTEVVLAVQRMLFGSAVDWDTVDRRLSEIEDPSERLKKLRDYVAREPDDPQGQIRLVELLAANNQTEQALTLGRRLRERGLLTLGIARQLGDVLARAQLRDEAVRTYSEIVEFDPQNRDARMLLGDIYLGHGWYEPAYRQFKTVADTAPDDPLSWLRLASAAAGNGRVDEALRIERRVATAQGRPGVDDPRRWARLWSAARVARLIAEPPKENAPSRASLERKLKELSLFSGGTGSLTITSWEDMRADFVLTTEVEEVPMALGDISDASVTGLNAVLWSREDAQRAQLVARLRSVPLRDGVAMIRHDIHWDGKRFEVKVSRHELAAKETRLVL